GEAGPPQGHGLHPSDRRQLLREPGRGNRRSDDRARRRHDPHHREPDLQRHLPALQGHQLDLLPWRRRVDGVCRAVPDPDVSRPPYKDKFTRAIVDGELNRFYYDTAQISNAVTIGALAKLVPISQILYGTDYPYRTGLEHVKGLGAVFAGADLMAIERENALRIIPRLKAA